MIGMKRVCKKDLERIRAARWKVVWDRWILAMQTKEDEAKKKRKKTKQTKQVQ